MPQRIRTPLDSTEISEEASPNTLTVKTRRSHRKSRNGCIECKHRHIRCDERHPSCANCEIAERLCSFLKPSVCKQKPKRSHPHRPKQQQQQQQQPEATTALSSSLEVCNDSTAQAVHGLDKEHAEQQSLLLDEHNSHPAPGQAADQLSHCSLPTHYALPPITSYDGKSHQIPSPVSAVQPDKAHTPHSDCYPALLDIPEVEPKAIFTPQHMILLHHADKVPNFTTPHRSVVEIAVRHVVESPYLMDEVLAFTAFHMAYLYPGSAAYFRHLATELQNRALTSFTRLTETVPHDDRATAVPRFLFSALLGRHALADTLTLCRTDFHFFIDQFIECLNLNRGIRAVTPPAWDYMYNSAMRPFLSVVREAEQKIISPGNECDPLNRLMDGSDLNEVSIKACRQAISVLQWSFDLCNALDEDDYPQSASAFSVGVEIGFVDVLRKHRPEALVILGYFGVLLHRCRSFWAFGDAGASLIRAIVGQLGSYWQDVLAWPLHVLETEHN